MQLKPGATAIVRQETQVRNPQLWSPDDPNLYRVSFSLRENGAAVDDDEAPLGFRWYRLRMHQSIPHLNQKGIYDYYRRPKDVYYLYVSQWTQKPMVYIVSHTWTERHGAPGEKKSIKVYSNCERVELFLNGRSLGQKSWPLAWDVPFEPGDNQLRAAGHKGAEQVADSMTVRY